MKHKTNNELLDVVMTAINRCPNTELKEEAHVALKEIERRLPSDEEREAISTRIANDSNGNPRYVAHFLHFINPEDDQWAEEMAKNGAKFALLYKYDRALARAKRLGGRKFHNKQYGGGIVFQCYGEKEMRELAERAKAIKL